MSAELVEEALKLPKYRQQIEDAEIQVPVRDDPRTDDKQKGLVKSMRESHYERKEPRVTKEISEEERRAAMEALGIEMQSDEEAETTKRSELASGRSSEQDLQATIREQDDRLKKMEEMMAQMAAMMSVKS